MGVRKGHRKLCNSRRHHRTYSRISLVLTLSNGRANDLLRAHSEENNSLLAGSAEFCRHAVALGTLTSLNRTELNTTARAVNSDDHSKDRLPAIAFEPECSPLLSPGGLLVE
ncbi:hypothetical protein HZZ13_23195 [Bradyrhizobium sp. CNPSo 4010]|uniref:Uncharacterized protein n=1 Tax=Bradyrhizobium agreste TaxID=2751811 RepID=A0ABS0PTZ6_9BRAD|nr:hypothetical protein [Bradyrhizobium agreste]MBH5400679.1 hypothetical protein [Bradyrhizobium agreste]